MSHPPADITIRHLAKIVESSDDAIVSKDLNGIILSWNEAAERLFGYSSSEAIGQSIRMIIPAERQHEEDYVLAQIRAGEAIRQHETVRCRKNGKRVPISLTVSPIYDDNGRVIAASKIARDISERKQAERVRRHLAAIVESSDDAIVTKDLDSTIMSWNAAAERMFGYTAGEAIGRSIRMIIPEDLQSEEDEVLARIRSGQTLDHYETRRRRKDGSELRVSLSVSPIADEDGRIVGASKIARDVTERSRLLEAAREQARVTKQLGEIGSIVVATLDQSSIVQKVTDVATALTGADFGAFFYRAVDRQSGGPYALYTVSGLPPDSFAAVSQREVDSVRAGYPETVVRSNDLTIDPRFRERPPYPPLPEGHPVKSYLGVPVKAPTGDVIGGLVFGHAQPNQFGELDEQLASGIATWASVALENARLYLEAREADRLKDEFLAVLSHELRTPLNAIVGYARLLRGGILSGDKAQRGLETLDRNATALTQIVEDVLDISRIISGKIRLELRPLELSLVVHNAIATVQPAADAKGVRIETIVDSSIGSVSGDADRLQQVVWNLLSNAVKFTAKEGHVQVRIEPADGFVEIVVSDTGVGIGPDFLPHVFERFRQADAGTTRNTGGLGLGLSIVRHIVEMHGGSVFVESEGEGRGATFRVRLPLFVRPDNMRVPGSTPRPERRQPLAGLGDLTGIRVLAVDDEQDSLGLLRVVLESTGADVVTISSPGEALERIAEVKPHVLVVDLAMPEMDGFDFISHVRASPVADVREIPAAALTAFARSDDRTKALQRGFEMHLAKPVDPGELVASVATLVRRRRR